jgi:SPP1 family predicted phage head-tail adaptor
MTDHVCSLITETNSGFDGYGNPVTLRTSREVFCQILSVTRTEFYSAATAGIHPEFIIRLSDHAEYQGEKLVEVDGELFSVVRVYRGRDKNDVELTVERRLGDE